MKDAAGGRAASFGERAEPAAEEVEFMLALAGLCRLARTAFDAPVASLCLSDGRTHWIDLDAAVDPAAWEFATSLAGRPDATGGPMVIEDAARHPAHADLPLVSGAPAVRFLASAPTDAAGSGRLAVFDTQARAPSVEAVARLAALGTLAGQCLALERRAREAEQREAEFRLLAETSTDTIVRGNLDGIRLYISPSVRSLLGYEPEELVGRRAMEIVHPDDIAGFAALMQRIRAGHLDIGDIEVRQRHRNGAWVWMEASLRLTYDRATGAPNGYVASVRGIDRRKNEEARLEHLATHDALTGLANRALLGEHLVQATERLRQGGRRFAVLYMDIDHFKQINDGFGHRAGDVVLREVAARFQAVLGPEDIVARLGGDEFALIHTLEADISEAGRLAWRLIAAMAEPVAFAGTTIPLGLSIGIAIAPDRGSDADALIASADRALYEAKLAGRNTFRFASETV
ncbi:sensor domain-containing diguanylate cyclase [Ancylobacter defluvii]|uniref:PAS domain S-box-containing protein/diguanylate cyclase (GGDEF)-like protein n=1 Tax=Ancylobacter defluvii TaxID=1282440 RepID=A0A9W6K248_9HYPH|nr:sensor domain-containing diguanylate cyclase [Ancylobacter defluvii]MBS7586287.1 sensor domain-containing diguanylate cyclase [Ancylobacter defluvii]GLK85568.1 hypothetical protein GCM10017653_36380 [Ancylobacter defluvii]